MHVDNLTSEKVDILKQIFQRPIAYHKVFATELGVTGAVMLSQAIYWDSNKVVTEREGWFYKTQEEWEEETGLTRKEQETARKRCKKHNFLEEKLIGVPAKLWFKVNWDKILEHFTDNRQVCTNWANKDAHFGQTSMPLLDIHTIHRVPIDYPQGGGEQKNEPNEDDLYGKSNFEGVAPILQEQNEARNEWLNKQHEVMLNKERSKKIKVLRKKYPYKSKAWYEKQVEKEVITIPKVVYDFIPAELDAFINWWIDEINKGIPMAKNVELVPLWYDLRKTYSVAQIRCAVRIAKHHYFWKTHNTPQNLFRKTNSEGQPMDVINTLLNYKGDRLGDELKQTFLNKKQDYFEEMKKEGGI